MATMPPIRSDKKARRALRTSSIIALPDISEKEHGAARIPLFDLLGMTRFGCGLYLDSFYTTIDDEYGAFAALPYAREAKQPIARRVSASIRTIAAFSAWYPVIWAFLARGFIVANVTGAGAAVIVGYSRLRIHPDPSSVALTVICSVLALIATARLSLRLTRIWPYDVLVLLVAGTSFATLAEVVARSIAWWSSGPAAAAAGIAVFCGVNATVLAIAQAMSQYVTWRKINAFPEEEIIETTALVLAAFHKRDASWRLPEERARQAANIEWAARRIERELVAPYAGGRPGADEEVRADAAARAAAFRALRRELVFPNDAAPVTVRTFLWNALQNEAAGRWGALERATPGTFSTPRSARVVVALRSIAAIGLPVAIALVALQVKLPALDVAFQRNIAITALGWSVLSLLAVINPRQFEQQASAAKTLGDLLKQSR